VRVRSYGHRRPLLIDRARFDGLLRRAACTAGVEVIAPATARSPRRLGTGAWAIPIETPNGPSVVGAGFLVEARGRRGGTGGRADGAAIGPAAISGAWEVGISDLVETRIEAGRDEWLWGSPLPAGLYGATVFLEPERLAGTSRVERERMYLRLL